MGNDRARSLYLARLPKGYAEPTPDTADERCAEFIRQKYVRLKWAAPELRAERQTELAKRSVARRAAAAQGGTGGASGLRSRKKGGAAIQPGSGTPRPMPSLSSESL